MSAAEHQFLIEPAAPFRLDLTAWALRRRAHNEIDRWDGRVYRRALPLGDGAIGLAVTQVGSVDAPRLAVTLSDGDFDRDVERQARDALVKVLGLEADLTGFAAMAASDPYLDELALRVRGLKPPRFPTVFEGLVNGIACQQLSLTVGVHLLSRLTAAYGRPVGADTGGIRAFPGPSELAAAPADDLKSLGFSGAKARAIIDVAAAILEGSLDLEALDGGEDDVVQKQLMSLRGIGRWTAQYVMLRGLGRLHMFPGDDVGARNKLKSFLGIDEPLDYEGVERAVSRWQPYGGLVYFHLLIDSLSRAGLVDD